MSTSITEESGEFVKGGGESVKGGGESALAKLRHDLRTPINHILGYSELVAEELADDGITSVAGDLEKIRNAAQQLLSMVGENLSEEGFARLRDGIVSPLYPDVDRRSVQKPPVHVEDGPA